MSFVVVLPEALGTAATDLATIGMMVSAAHTASATPTMALVPAAADEVSTSIARLFSQHAANYHGLGAQAAAYSDQFMQHLRTGAQSYAGAEVAAAASLQHVTPATSAATSALPGP